MLPHPSGADLIGRAECCRPNAPRKNVLDGQVWEPLGAGRLGGSVRAEGRGAGGGARHREQGGAGSRQGLGWRCGQRCCGAATALSSREHCVENAEVRCTAGPAGGDGRAVESLNLGR